MQYGSSLAEVEIALAQKRTQIVNIGLTTGLHYENATSELALLEEEYKNRIKKLNVITLQNPTPSNNKILQRSILLFFEANRVSTIAPADSARGLDLHRKGMQYRELAGSTLEQHLVNLHIRRLQANFDNDLKVVESICAWFTSFEENLQLLMEDSSTKLKYDPNNMKFTIEKHNRPATSFQTLSSGHAAIFDIYSELIMQAEQFSITPNDLSGVVFIDEIEAHLHVSLQRLVLPFLERSFPNIQFIVTTHSPFILTSVNDSVTYDLSSNTYSETDISFYPYSNVLEGVLGTRPTSILLDEAIGEISNLLNSPLSNLARLKELTSQVKLSESLLDSRSRSFLLLGLNAILDQEESDV